MGNPLHAIPQEDLREEYRGDAGREKLDLVLRLMTKYAQIINSGGQRDGGHDDLTPEEVAISMFMWVSEDGSKTECETREKFDERTTRSQRYIFGLVLTYKDCNEDISSELILNVELPTTHGPRDARHEP